jgi:propionyl-CoA carboxylase alpha chain
MATITTLLVANRGEIATRVMRTAHAMGISCVAVFSDADAGEPFVRHADEAVRLPGTSARETYLDGDGIVAAAQRTNADAIHPGYGFLSESGEFARACHAAGLVFVGPPPAVIELMGSKLDAKRVMAEVGVPVLPHVVVNETADPDDPAWCARVYEEVGVPVLVKSAFGGGGRGMRVVDDLAALPDAIAACRREAAAAFGDGTVFVERYVDRPRHVEVQIVADAHGAVVSLGDRDCSIQRHHQKIIEESPAPNVDAALRSRLSAAAEAGARAAGYVGVGTIEFVLNDRQEFFFIEMNARLQVEHPVTEAVTGLDLVQLQLLVTEGHALPAEVLTTRPRGHAIEARLCAEDALADHAPSTGVIRRFTVPESPGVRVDGGVGAGSSVGPHYDSLLAKMIASATTRDEARRLLAAAMAGTRIHGVTTNRDLLLGILRDPDFRAAQVDTGYLVRHDVAVLVNSTRDPRADATHALAAALADQSERRRRATVLRAVPSGWRNVPSEPQRADYVTSHGEWAVRYAWTPAGLTATVNEESLGRLSLIDASAEHVDLEIDGVRRRYDVGRYETAVHVDSALGASAFRDVPRFPEPARQVIPGSLTAPIPGTVVRVPVTVGERVSAGAPLVVLEAMKMEHTISASSDGTVTALHVSAGQVIEAGALLAVVDGSES